MDPISFAVMAFKIVPLIISAGEDIAPFVTSTIAVLQGGADPTDEQWAALHATEDRLRAQLNASA